VSAIGWLALASVAAVVAVLTVLASLLIVIVGELEAIGGSPTSLLSKIRLGRRAIESQTAHVGRELPRLNERLAQLACTLATIEEGLPRLSKAPEDGR
jgi:hypothetical protein